MCVLQTFSAREKLEKRTYKVQASENPNSSLAADQTEAQFASRYSDPNHPASSGSLVALVTGGAMQGGRARRREPVERRMGRPLGRENREKKGKLRRLLQQVSENLTKGWERRRADWLE